MNVNIVVIVQARMNSSRLPGKVMKTVLGKPLLGYLTDRLLRVKKNSRLVIATTNEKKDQAILDFCRKRKISYYCGDENDVLRRYYDAANYFLADVIVRITADCPLMDSFIVDRLIEEYLDNYPYFQYVSNVRNRTYPRGMDAEVFSIEILREAFENAKEKFEREHVTPYMYLDKERKQIKDVFASKDLSHYRWTVDTYEDFVFVKEVIESLYPFKRRFTMSDILELLERKPELANINKHIRQKNVEI